MTPMHPMATAFANTGATDDQLRAAMEIARERKPAPQTVSPNYLQPILAEVLHPPAPRPTKQHDSWWASDAGIDRKGRELGMQPIGKETYPAYKDRIFEEIRKREGRVAA